MRYLKSREGAGQGPLGRRSQRQERRKTKTFHVPGVAKRPSFGETMTKEPLPSISAAHEPCSSHKLVPPVELMTRARALQLSYWERHQPRNIQKLKFEKKESEEVLKKREDIYTRIRAAETAAVERKRKDFQAVLREQGLRRREETKLSLAQSGDSSEQEHTNDSENVDLAYRRQSWVSGGEDLSCSAIAWEGGNNEDSADGFSFITNWVKEKNNPATC